jgi:hypothetical protein
MDGGEVGGHRHRRVEMRVRVRLRVREERDGEKGGHGLVMEVMMR